jgi:hypothetical protein
MNARILTAATIVAAFSGVLTAKAADSQMLSLVMPDAKVVAGVNVDSAKTSPFGLWVISQMQSNAQHLQELKDLTGFDPLRDIHEILAASTGTAHNGLAMARGNFDTSKITTAAAANGGLTETYAGFTILEDPKQTGGFAFLDSTLVVAGDIASVKGALDRLHNPQPLPAAVTALVSQWSASQDAWAITTVPPSTLHPAAGTPNIPGLGANAQGILQKIQQICGGVKFGANVVVTAQAQADNAPDAAQMAAALQFLVNLAQTQAAQHPEITSLVQGLAINSSGVNVNVTLSLPQAQIQQLVNHATAMPVNPQHPAIRKR